MLLEDLLAGIEVLDFWGNPAGLRVSGVVCDSRQVASGSVFVCIRGRLHDGHRYAATARQRGASAIVVQDPASVSYLGVAGGLPLVQVADSRLAYALMCAAFHGHPSQGLMLTGVTGTNGKTTTTHLIEGIYRAAGHQTGLVGTIHTRIGAEIYRTRLTTPEAGDLQHLLARMRDNGVHRGVLEVSSHALKMHRVAGCRFQTGVFTNLSRDHLDFHGSWEDYFSTKRRLFEMLDRQGGGMHVINTDDPWGRRLAQEVGGTVVRYGLQAGVDVWGHILQRDGSGVRMLIQTPEAPVVIALPLPGTCNVYNALAAAAVAWAHGIPTHAIKQGLETAPEIPGRFQAVRCGQPFQVFVDFAHNPEGLQHALQAVGQPDGGEKWLVFGCQGGDQDQFKRRMMGRIAAQMADRVILTTDNIYHEDPEQIIHAIEQGLRDAGLPRDRYHVIMDRREAITAALTRAQRGDLVLLAGRGHEREQAVGRRRVALDDVQVARDTLVRLYGDAAVAGGQTGVGCQHDVGVRMVAGSQTATEGDDAAHAGNVFSRTGG